MKTLQKLKGITFIVLFAIVLLVSGCKANGNVSVEVALIESQINSFQVEVTIEGESNEKLEARLYSQDDVYMTGYYYSMEEGSNVLSFSNLPNQTSYDVVVFEGNEEVTRTTVEVGTILFTGVTFNGEQKTGFLTTEDDVIELNHAIGMDRNNHDSGEIITLNFDNPNDYPIEEIMISGVTYTEGDFESGSTNTEVHIRLYPDETYGYAIEKVNRYTISYQEESVQRFPLNHRTFELVTVKEVPEVLSLDSVVPLAHREGQTTIAVYLDLNFEEVEFNAITVNGVRYDEFDEEYSTRDVYMFVVDVTQKSGTETLTVDSLEYNDLSGQKEYDITGLNVSFNIQIDDIGKGTLTSPIRINSIDDLLRMGQSPVWSRENTTYELSTDLDFDDLDDYEDKSLYDRFSKYGSIASGWEPFGWDEDYDNLIEFNSILDGNNRTISNLFINMPGSVNVAFMTYLGEYGTVKEITFEDVYIIGTGATVLSMHNLGTIDKVAVTNSNDEEKDYNQSIVHVVGQGTTGVLGTEGSGLAGYLTNEYVLVDRCEDDPLTTYVNECLVGVEGTISNSYSEAYVVALNNTETLNGLGQTVPSSLSVKWEEFGLPSDYFGSESTEEFAIESTKLGGLLIGNYGGTVSKSYTDSVVYADVTSRAYVGGIASDNQYIIQEVYSVGSVTAIADTISVVGGIISQNNAVLADSYSSTDVYAETVLKYDDNNEVIQHLVSVGGLVGYNAGGNNGVIRSISINQEIYVASPSLGRSLNYDFVAANNFIAGRFVHPYYHAGKNLQQYYINSTLTVNEFVDDLGNDIEVTPKAPIPVSVFDLMNKDWYLWEGNTQAVITSYAKLVQRRVDWEESSWDFTVIEDGYMPVFKTIKDSKKQPMTVIDENQAKLEQLGAIAVFSNQELNYTDEDKTLGTIQFDFDITLAETTTEVTNIEIHLHYIDIDAGKIKGQVFDDEGNAIVITNIDVTNGTITIIPDFNLVPREEDGTPLKYALVVYGDVDGVRTEIGIKNWIEYYGVEFED